MLFVILLEIWRKLKAGGCLKARINNLRANLSLPVYMEHFTQLRALLKQEQDADLQQFLQGVRAQPLTERVQAG
ncbi:MAG: hypothetical protein KGS48_15115, partial [Bacteroidetes bacterium]|nr:hypothetical protein [Bacteroidota bacterium]